MDKQHQKYAAKGSIAVKLVLAFMVPVFFTIMVGAISYNRASDAIIKNYISSSLQSIEMTSEYIQFGLESVDATSLQYSLDTKIKNYFNGLYKDKFIESNSAMEEIKSSMITKSVSDSFIENIHFLSTNVPSMTTAQATANILNQDLYKAFIESETGSVLQTTSDAVYWVGNNLLLEETFSLNKSKYTLQLIRGFRGSNACIIIDISTSALEDILSRLDFGTDSIVGFITEDGREFIATQGNQQTADPIFLNEDFYKESLNNEILSDNKEVVYQGENYLYLNSKIGNTGSMVTVLIPEQTLTNQVNSIKNITMLLVLISSVIAVLIVALLVGGIQRIIHYIIDELNKVADGNLTIKLNVKRRDEFFILATGINHMVDNMRSLIEKVKIQSESVTASSANVMEASDFISIATEGITSSIEEIKSGIYHQAQDSQDCLTSMDNLSSKIEIVNGETNEIRMITKETETSIKTGMDAMGVLNQKAQSTSKVTESIRSHILDLENKSLSIDRIIGTINSIAEETNLLSLNASIEAARAGEAGRGFQVVASEIRKLADQSVNAVKEIEIIIREIHDQTKETVKISNEADTIIAEQEIAVTNTEESFKDLNLHVKGLINNVDRIVDSISVIEARRVDTLSAIENISAVSEETAAASSTVSDSAEHQKEAVKDLSKLANELGVNAKSLSDMVLRFKV
jgi:methyl-accepting chemotaxis protein